LPTEELAEQLNRLRVRAGNPSVRELAKLTERQGPGRAMSRSTVQDKISGKSPPRLGQILALVQACADYANSIGAPFQRRTRTSRSGASMPKLRWCELLLLLLPCQHPMAHLLAVPQHGILIPLFEPECMTWLPSFRTMRIDQWLNGYPS